MQGVGELLLVGHGPAVKLGDHVPLLDAGLLRGAARFHSHHAHAGGDAVQLGDILGDGLPLDAQVGGLAGVHLLPGGQVHQLFQAVLRLVDGDGETDVVHRAAAAGGGSFRLVDADELPGHVQQGAAGVAGVDGGVRLDEPGGSDSRAALVGEGQVPVKGADHAGGHRLAVAQGVADGHHRLAQLQLIAVADGGNLQLAQRLGGDVGKLHRHHGQVVVHVGALDLGLHRALVHKAHRELAGALHHMVVGGDEQLRLVLVHDHPGAGALHLDLLSAPEEAAHLLHGHGGDGHHRGHGLSRHGHHSVAVLRLGGHLDGAGLRDALLLRGHAASEVIHPHHHAAGDDAEYHRHADKPQPLQPCAQRGLFLSVFRLQFHSDASFPAPEKSR